MAGKQKVSVRLGKDELRSARRLSIEHGVSVSAFINDAVRMRLHDASQLRDEMRVSSLLKRRRTER